MFVAHWFGHSSNIVTINRWWLILKHENCLNCLSWFQYQQNVVPSANRCFSLKHELSSWADSFKRFRSRVRSLSSAHVKGTCWSSSFGLYITSLATTILSLFRIWSIFHVSIWLRNRKVWAMRDWYFGRRNIGILDMVVVLAIYSF